MSGSESPYSKDPRIKEVLDLLVKFAVGDFSLRAAVSDKGDEIERDNHRS